MSQQPIAAATARAIEVADHERNAVARAGGEVVQVPAYGWERQPRTTIAGMPASTTQPVSCPQGLHVRVKAELIAPSQEGAFTLRPSSHRTRAKRRG
ncbi:hypothetical protein ACIQF5_29075 [Streptomyces goshikiensis]|uniref:hypothetical protein n=1 Tax=Streptomyces goshikiensis TaxID=1942 RepID=UPI003824CF76